MKKTDYYLAHPFDSRKWVREWQLKIQRSSNIKITNPFYSKYRNDVETWDHKDSSGNKIYEKLNSDYIVSRDLELIRRQEKGTIAIVDGSISYGTIQEMVYSKLYGKIVYALITNGHHNHPWLKFHSDKVFTDITKLENHLKNEEVN